MKKIIYLARDSEHDSVGLYITPPLHTIFMNGAGFFDHYVCKLHIWKWLSVLNGFEIPPGRCARVEIESTKEYLIFRMLNPSVKTPVTIFKEQ